MNTAIRYEKEDRITEWQPCFLIPLLYTTVIRIAEEVHFIFSSNKV